MRLKLVLGLTPKCLSKIFHTFLYLFVSENVFLPMKTCFFSRNKPTNQHLVASPNKCFFASFCLNLFPFVPFLHYSQIIEKPYFDQGLECTAPKRWLKYTSSEVENKQILFKFGRFGPCRN